MSGTEVVGGYCGFCMFGIICGRAQWVGAGVNTCRKQRGRSSRVAGGQRGAVVIAADGCTAKTLDRNAISGVNRV